jgi:hypothetical protein
MTDKAKIRIGRLTSVGRGGIEIARLYRCARRGEIETIEAYRLASVLSVLKSCLEASEVERRLADLEAAISRREQAYRPRLVQ